MSWFTSYEKELKEKEKEKLDELTAKLNDLSNRWLQIREPKAYEAAGKNDKQVPRMYMKLDLDHMSIQTVTSHIFPNNKKYQNEATLTCDFDLIIYNQHPSTIRYLSDLISPYELITNPALIKKLDCVIIKQHQSKLNEQAKLEAIILKSALSHKC
jgi:hypothetical protein